MSITTKAALRGSIASKGCSLPVRFVMRSSAAAEIAILCILASSISRFVPWSRGPIRVQYRTKQELDRAYVRWHVGSLGILDRSRRHLYRRDRPAAGRRAGDAQTPVGESRGLSRRGGARHPPS